MTILAIILVVIVLVIAGFLGLTIVLSSIANRFGASSHQYDDANIEAYRRRIPPTKP